MNAEVMANSSKLMQEAQELATPTLVREMLGKHMYQSQEQYSSAMKATVGANKEMEKVFRTAQKGIEKINRKLFENLTANMMAVLRTTEKLVDNTDVADAMDINIDYLQTQIVTANHQARELYELSGKVSSEVLSSTRKVYEKAVKDVGS